MNSASLSLCFGDFRVWKSLEMAGRRALSPAAAKELGEQRESWCAVEMKKEQSWDRKTRKHSDQILHSTVFDIHQPQYEPRCTFEVNAPTHRERRHFDKQCKFFFYIETFLNPHFLLFYFFSFDKVEHLGQGYSHTEVTGPGCYTTLECI